MSTTKYLPIALGLGAVFLVSPALASSSLWEHNGSTVSLAADGSNREFHYDRPRPEMLEAGARPGSLLFAGRVIGKKYAGTAYIFNPRCGAISYEVSGPILDNFTRVVLRGQAPRVNFDCNVVGYVSDTLEFSYLKTASTTSRAEIPLVPLNKGVNVRVVNIEPNDILKMREYPTENSRVVYTIPPDETGIVYLGEAQGQWIRVRYDSAEGWVNRLFVKPLVTPGRRLR